MKRLTGTAIFMLTGLALAACGENPGEERAEEQTDASVKIAEADLASARAAAKELGETLKGRLQAAMGEGGPVAAVDVCQTEAPEIANDISQRLGVDVARTAPRVRNTSNAPDAWEADQLETFRAAMAAGEDPAKLEAAEIVTLEGQTVLRWMKPIPMAEMCATCHGSDIAPEVQAAVAEAYPEDAATGFRTGELRGAFTVTVPVEAR